MGADALNTGKTMINEAILKDLGEKLKKVSFGSVTIKINNARIVQIEVTENKRFDEMWSSEGSGI